MSNFKERPRTLIIALGVPADIENAFHQMRILGWLRAFYALPAGLSHPKLASRENS